MKPNIDVLLEDPACLAVFGQRLAESIRLGKRVLAGRPDLLELAAFTCGGLFRDPLEKIIFVGGPLWIGRAAPVDTAHPDIVALTAELRHVLPELGCDLEEFTFTVQRHVATLSQKGSYRIPIWAERAMPDPQIEIDPLRRAIRAAGTRLADGAAAFIYAPPWLDVLLSAHERLDLAEQWEDFTEIERREIARIGDKTTGLRVRRLGHAARIEQVTQGLFSVQWSRHVVALGPDSKSVRAMNDDRRQDASASVIADGIAP